MNADWLPDETRVFDLIELDGKDLRPAPLEQRKGKLEKVLAHSDRIRFSEPDRGRVW